MSQPAEKLKPISLEDFCERIIAHDEQIFFHYKGHDFVLLSAEDFEYYDALEEKRLNELADEALKEPGENIPFEEIRKKYGL